MAGIKAPILDILTKLSAISVPNAESTTALLYARIWNNQLKDIKTGGIPVFPRPAAFVEIINPATYEIIGLGFRSADLGIRIHLIHDFTNGEGTFEQDLPVFDLRDKIISNGIGLSGLCPTACGPLNCIREEQEYDHDNIYHYIMDFVTNFTDSKGSAYDPDAGKYIDTANPDLDADVVLGGVVEPVEETQEFILPANRQ